MVKVVPPVLGGSGRACFPRPHFATMSSSNSPKPKPLHVATIDSSVDRHVTSGETANLFQRFSWFVLSDL